MNILTTDQLVFHYKIADDDQATPHTALDGVTLEIAQGSFVAVLGHNGSGKSTLAKHLNALLVPSSGQVWVAGLDSREATNTWAIRKTCGMVFQNPDNQIVATMVDEDVAFGLENMGIPSGEIAQRVEAALAAVGMSAHKTDMPAQLSGGQKQRVAIAGIIAMRPQVVVFDESTAMLDPVGRRDIMHIIHELKAGGITVVLITHFMDEAIQADRVIVMDKGRVVIDDTPTAVFSQPDILKACSLELPVVTELAHRLLAGGYNLPAGILTTAQLVAGIQASLPPTAMTPTETTTPLTTKKPAPTQLALQLKNLTHTYNPGTPFQKHALTDMNIDIAQGSFTAIIGHTGSGKSTLIQHLNSLIKPTAGQVLFKGADINADPKQLKTIRQQIGLVFQYPEYQIFEETIYKDVAYGPKNMGLGEADIQIRVEQALRLVGIAPALYHQSPFELSGGQKRRVAIAGILAMKPSVLVLDEPTSGLDPQGRHEIMEQIKALHEQTGTTIVLVSHSMEDVAKYADQIVVLNQGKVAYQGTPAQVFAHAYELENMGLAVPSMNYLFHELNGAGYQLPTDIFTVSQAYEVLTTRWPIPHATQPKESL